MNDNEGDFPGKQRQRSGAGKTPAGAQYTAKDFQLDVLGRLEETQGRVESLQELWRKDSRAAKEERLLRFDGRTLVAIGAIALSLTGYVLQDARTRSKQDTDIETTKARVTRLEQIAETNTEGRIRMEVELGELRDGQEEIKRLINARDKNAVGTSGEDRHREKQQSGNGGPGEHEEVHAIALETVLFQDNKESHDHDTEHYDHY